MSAVQLYFWSPPPPGSFKINFDRASKGNLGETKYGRVCRYATSSIMKVYYGSIGAYTNKSVELKFLIQGLKLVSREGWFPDTVEEDSKSLSRW